MRFLLIILLSVFCQLAICQSPADWWYFGTQAGLHFTANGPIADANGQLSTNEGSATISDENGDLLFYTDGIEVFDASHTQMPNGFGLNGSNSSSQSAVILKKPGSLDSFYIFTVTEEAFPAGLQYTLVDMALNGGLGDVVNTEKNIPMLSNVAEKITIVKKSGGAWVITHKLPGDTVFAFEVTNTGVNLTPVSSQTGFPLTTQNFWGYMKANVQGDQIALVSRLVNEITLMDFDKSTGLVSNAIHLDQSINSDQSYGLEFSPNGKFLYAMSFSFSDIRQYNLTLGTAQAISNSEVIIGSSGTGGGALQLGPDCKIYIARRDSNYISVINNPNVLGLDAGFVDQAVVLSPGRQSEWGLPGFAQACVPLFYDSLNCLNDSTYFILDTADINLVNWNFDDLGSGANNTSTDFFPVHLFTDTGLFTIRLIYERLGVTDTVFQTLKIFPRQSISLPADTSICSGDSIRLEVSQPYSTYLWSDGSTSDSITVTDDTSIAVTVFGICDTVSSSVTINYDDPIQFDLGPDTTICSNGPYLLESGIQQDAIIQWSTGDSTASIVVTQSGGFEMNAVNGCGSLTDQVNITLRQVPQPISLPEDSTTCGDLPITVSISKVPGLSYLWSNGDTASSIEVDSSAQVWLEVSNQCDTVSDTTNIVFAGVAVDFGPDTTICDFDTITVDAGNPGATYVWNTGDTTRTVKAHTQGRTYRVTITNANCIAEDGIRVDYSELLCEDITCTLTTSNVLTPNGDGINDIWRSESDCDITRFQLRIYNRWGQMIHYSDNGAFGWDGYVNGQPAPEGTYYYILEFKDNVVVAVDQQEFRGAITLFRD